MNIASKQKQPQLKYPNATWITIRTPIYSRTPSASGMNSPKFRSIAELPTIDPVADTTAKQLFNHSNTMFSDQEVDMIQYATNSHEIGDCISLHKNSSRLKQIKIAQQELHPEYVLGKSQIIKTQRYDEDISDSERYNEDLDSVISYDDELHPINFDKDEVLTSRSKSVNNQELNNYVHDVASKKEIEDHIWDYCRKSNDPEDTVPHYSIIKDKQKKEKKYTPYDMEFYVDGMNQTRVKKAKTSLGMQKKLNAISHYSSVEKEKRDFIDMKPKLSDQDRLKLESSITAMRYASYMQNQNKKVPDFLDGLDFSAAKVKFMKKKSSLTQPASPRSSALHRPLPRL